MEDIGEEDDSEWEGASDSRGNEAKEGKMVDDEKSGSGMVRDSKILNGLETVEIKDESENEGVGCEMS